MDRVLIIGNGFDLDLGLKTSYAEFMNSDYFREIDKSSDLMRYLVSQKELNKWIDLELELRSFIFQRGIYEDMIRELRDEELEDSEFEEDPHSDNKESYFQLCRALEDYLKTLDYSAINTQSVAAMLIRTVYIASQPRIFNYNYTNFYEIRKVLRCSGFSGYTPVHGSIKNSSIILGIDDDVEIHEFYYFMIKSHNPNYRSCNIRSALDEAEEVIFFGHSLGSTDYHYFSDFFLNQSGNNGIPQKRKKIRIFTKNEASRLDILAQLRNMNNKKTNQLFDLNDFRIYCTHEERDQTDIEEYCTGLAKAPDGIGSSFL